MANLCSINENHKWHTRQLKMGFGYCESTKVPHIVHRCIVAYIIMVPAHPGCPGQSPQSRKMVVCCVCVMQVSETTHLNFTKFYVHVACVAVAWSSSGQMYRVVCYVLLLLSMTSHFEWTYWWHVATTAMSQQRHVRANTHAALYWLHPVQDDDTKTSTSFSGYRGTICRIHNKFAS